MIKICQDPNYVLIRLCVSLTLHFSMLPMSKEQMCDKIALTSKKKREKTRELFSHYGIDLGVLTHYFSHFHHKLVHFCPPYSSLCPSFFIALKSEIIHILVQAKMLENINEVCRKREKKRGYFVENVK